MPRLTLYGIYNFDKSLFSDIILPDGLNKDLLVAEIFSKSGDLYPYYQVPYILKQNITYWFIRRKYDFEMMYRALHAEYNPIENYNRYEILNRNSKNGGKDSTTRDYTNNGSSTDLLTASSRDIGNTSGNQSGTDTETVSAYNTADFTNRTKHLTTQTNSSSNEQNSNASSKNENTTKSTSTDNSTLNYGATRDELENNHIHGNIGVTTTQQMIEAEEEMRMKFDLYSMIASMFEKEFIVQLY